MSKKALLTATVQSHIAQFHKPLIELLKKANYEIHIAAKDNLAVKNGLKIENVDRIFNVEFSRSPKSTDNIKAYKQLKKIIDENKYDIISCNTPMGGIVTRLAARKARKTGTKVFYTAHGFHFYHGAPKKNWLIYYPIEKFFIKYTDALITITKEDYKLSKKKFKTNVYYIHGVGVDASKYIPVDDKTKSELRKKHNINKKSFVCICTGELKKNKNQNLIVGVAKKIIKRYPDFKLFLAGNGPKEKDLKELIKSLGIESNVIMLGYTTILQEYVQCADLIVSASKREGLPLNIIEAMLCKKAVVASVNRGHNELVENGKTGFLVNKENEFENKIIELINDREKLNNMGECGYTKAQIFTMENVKKELNKIYCGGKI